MLKTLLNNALFVESLTKPKEGDLYKVITAYGKTFEIKYGFYEDCDRHIRYAEPVPIYPCFITSPQFTEDGVPFVTAMQTPCENFQGSNSETAVCDDCIYYRCFEDLLGTCSSAANRKDSEDRLNE